MNDTRKLLMLLPLLGAFSCAIYFFIQIPRATSSCQLNLKQIGLGHMQYTRDYDETSPLANNWATVLQPYTKNSRIFRCPSNNGYSFNRYLSGIPFSQIEKAGSEIPTVFDSTSTQPNSSDFGTSYLTDGAHFMWKSGRGTNVMFYDGHVEWLQVKPTFHTITKTPKPKISGRGEL